MAKKVTPDVTTEGKVFFPAPQLITVNGDKVATSDPNPVLDIVGNPGKVRTSSCNFDHAMNKPKNYPIEGVKYACDLNPTYNEASQYLAQQWIHGYGKGAIVVRRWAMAWRFMYPHQWGYIHAVHHTPQHKTNWAPYTVKWFEVGQEEGAWAEDLLIIHAAVDDELLCSIVEEQGFDVSEAMDMIEQRRKGAV